MSTPTSPAPDAHASPAPDYGTPDPVLAGAARTPEPTTDPAAEPAPEPAPDPTARAGRGPLRRSDRRLLAGVCGGIAEYVAVDPTLVRLAIVLLTLFGGTGVVLYAVGWLVMPDSRGDVVAQRLVERLQRR